MGWSRGESTGYKLQPVGNACKRRKMCLPDVASMEQLLRIIQPAPSPKAEPFKLWLARVGAERIEVAEIEQAKKGTEIQCPS